jgi:aspartate aminotransferase-like enzyme
MASEEIRFFLPGPTYVTEEVRRAMTGPMIGHRSAVFKALYTSITPRLQQVTRTTGDVMLATSSATLVMESAILSTVRTEVLNLVCGAFSERWHAISQMVGRQADRVSVPWGEAVDPELVRSALRRKRYEAVTLAHNETSTGVINPLREIAEVVHEESDALVLVDAVSSLAGAPVEVDSWGLAVPPGLTVFTLSERAAEQVAGVDNRGFYTDLLRYRDKHRAAGTITTPALPIFYALDRQLERIVDEGMEARWERHRELQRLTARWAEANGFEYASAENARSPTISCLTPPAGVASPDLVQALAKQGFTIGGGYGEWKPTTLRIGHMGEVREQDLEGLFGAIEEILASS